MFEEVVEMQSSNFGYVPFAALWLVLITSPVLSSIDRDTNQLDGDLLSALMEYHGISEDQVIERLAHEAEAARLYSEIPGLVGDAYAGAWFDENTLKWLC